VNRSSSYVLHKNHLAEVANLCSGDYDLILDGIHENFLQLHYHDPVMQKTVSLNYINLSVLYWAFTESVVTARHVTLYSCYVKVECLNSLGVSDLMHKYILRTQNMPIYGKDPEYPSFVTFHYWG
jgi:hypothetical protein